MIAAAWGRLSESASLSPGIRQRSFASAGKSSGTPRWIVLSWNSRMKPSETQKKSAFAMRCSSSMSLKRIAAVPEATSTSRDTRLGARYGSTRTVKRGSRFVASFHEGVDIAPVERDRRGIATDPVVAQGEMIPEFHKYYGSAALMLVNDGHARVAKQPF